MLRRGSSTTERPRRRGFTIIELLMIVAVLGVAAAMLVPSISSMGSLRTRAAVRALVADVAYAQSDAMASQARRVLVFGRVARWDDAADVWVIVDGNGYTLYAPPPGAGSLDLAADAAPDPADPSRPYSRDFDAEGFGGAVLSNASFDGDERLIFGELGDPAQDLTGDLPGGGGSLRVTGVNAVFDVFVEAYTGRVSVAQVGGGS